MSGWARISEADVEAVENLCEAAVRAGHIQTAIAGWALCLRLRLALSEEAEIGRMVDEAVPDGC